MASNQTPVYGLNQWSLEDGIIMAEFNADNEKLEQALVDAAATITALQQETQILRADRTALEQAIAAAKAEAKSGDATLQTAIDAAKAEAKSGDAILQTAVDAAKAEAKSGDATLQTAINAAKTEAKAGDNTLLQALNTAKATIPNIATGTYVGTGTSGVDNPNSLTFTFEPKLLIVTKDLSTELANTTGMGSMFTFIALRGAPGFSYVGSNHLSTGVYLNHLSWNGATVEWWSDSTDIYNQASFQFNEKDKTYHYFAIG